MRNNAQNVIRHLLSRRPNAISDLKGSRLYPDIRATVLFYQTAQGVLCITEAYGLPYEQKCSGAVFGMHIHNGNSCTGNSNDSFENAGTHYNPNNCPHPYHAGDLPPLFGNHGVALSGVLTDRFSVQEIIGKTIIIHSMPDDFTTQPSGNSGDKIACGVIHGIK